MIEAAPELAVLLVALGGLIFCYLAIYCARAFAGVASGTIGRLPIIGGWIDAGINTVVQKITNIFSEAADSCQSAMGWSFHLMARQVDWLGREINSHANLLWTLANLVPGVNLVRSLIAAEQVARREIGRLWSHAPATARAVVRPIEGELKALERWTYPRVKAAEHAIDVTIPKDIAGLRSRTRAVENDLAKAWDYLRSHPWTVVTDAFVGAVAVALSRLGLSWIRCPTASSFFNKRGCGAWNLIDDLLGFAFDLLILTNICTVIPLMEEAFSTVAAPLIGTLAAAGAGLCNAEAGPPETLPPPGLALPATASLSLYLP